MSTIFSSHFSPPCHLCSSISHFPLFFFPPSLSLRSCSSLRPEPHGRGGGSQPGQAESPLPEQDEEILGSDDDEQEDPNDYCRGMTSLTLAFSSEVKCIFNASTKT